MSKLYVIMPVINCLDLTKQAVESIKTKHTCSLILIDNDSNDGTSEWAQNSGRVQEYIKNSPAAGVAQSWNQGIKIAFKDPDCEYIAVLNNDIVLHEKTLDHLIDYMDKTGYLIVTGDNIQSRMSVEVMKQMELSAPYTDFDLWPIEGWRAEGPDFSCFLINRETIRVLGWFDENFKGAYCEDWDYHARISRAREHIKEHNDHDIDFNRVHAKRLGQAPYFHFASQTLKHNPQIRNHVSVQHGKNRSYYEEKWGGDHPDVMDNKPGTFKTPFGRADMNWRDW